MHKLISATIHIALLAALIALAGCNLPIRAIPPTPPPDSRRLTSTMVAIKTRAALATGQKLTQTAAASNPKATVPPPSDTPQPTVQPSNTPALPTATATATETATATITLTPSQTLQPSPTTGAYKCGITYLYPGSGTELGKGENFNFKVTFRNDGDATWKKAAVDFIYLSGPKYQTLTDVVKLPKDVNPGESVSLLVDMKVNTPAGSQNINWGLENAGTLFCYVGTTVIIK